MTIAIQNHGPLVTGTNYWGSEIERAGKLYVSPNAGAIRVLLPRSQFAAVNELRTAKYAIYSVGPWPEERLPVGSEILWEDGTDNPYCWHLSPESFAMLPAKPGAGQEWVVSVWVLKKDMPHKAIERPCRWRRVAKIPCMEEWHDGQAGDTI